MERKKETCFGDALVCLVMKKKKSRLWIYRERNVRDSNLAIIKECETEGMQRVAGI